MAMASPLSSASEISSHTCARGTVGGSVATSASATEPDVKVSLHPGSSVGIALQLCQFLNHFLPF